MSTTRYQRFLIKLVYMFIDVVCVALAIYFAAHLRHSTLPFDITFQSIFTGAHNPFQYLFVFWIVLVIFVVNAHSLYQTRREVFEGFEIGLVVKSISIAALLMVVVIYTLKVEGFPRTILTIGSGFMMVFLSVWRVIKRFLVQYMVKQGYNNFNVVIVGAGKVGRTLLDQIQKYPEMGLKVVGFLDNFKGRDFAYNGVQVIGKTADFPEIATRYFIDKIFITIHDENDAFLKIVNQSVEHGVAVRVIPQGFELMSGEFHKYNIGIVPILEYTQANPVRYQIEKRIFDFISSMIGFVILLPLFIIIGILIRLDSPGPVFYVSKRYGRNGQTFSMYKFRSMRQDADVMLETIKEKNEVSGPIFKMKNDPRMTRIGRILRKYSLDELPQILNVIKGEMSLVGPRPFPIHQVQKEDLKQLKRLGVRPGITGLWQIKGRSDLSFDKLLKWDEYYINNWSFWLDLNILILTIPVVIKGKGAY